MQVQFYEEIEDQLLKFAVIISKYQNKWVFCKHKLRDTFEIPGGHREENENILETAKRELYEETGGKNRVNDTGEELYGMLYYADIYSFEENLHSEMEKIVLFNELPNLWTYPEIQPKLIEYYINLGNK